MELDHPFRRNKSAFLKNKIVTIGAPPVRSGSEILSIIDHLDLKKVTEVNAYNIKRGISQSCGRRKRSITLMSCTLRRMCSITCLIQC